MVCNVPNSTFSTRHCSIPYAAIKERQIGKIPSLRAMNNKLREDANNLTEEVDILSEEIDILEPEADR